MSPIGTMSAIRSLSGAKRTYAAQDGIDANDPTVWSGRAVQEVSSSWMMRSCITVSGLCFAGCDDYVTKPYSPIQLLRMVRGYLGDNA
jgi:CheY-like chemotaxis protein